MTKPELRHGKIRDETTSHPLSPYFVDLGPIDMRICQDGINALNLQELVLELAFACQGGVGHEVR